MRNKLSRGEIHGGVFSAMSDSHRHGYITLGWIATIIGVLLFFVILDSKYSDAQKSSEYAQKCAEQYQGLTLAPAGTDAPYHDQEKAEGNEKQQSGPDWCDLAAQQSMAESTYWMNWAAWATVSFAGIGAVFIWQTLLATQDTVAETRRIGEAQVRAYLAVEKTDMKHMTVKGGKYNSVFGRLVIGWKNFGQSPARDVGIYTQVRTIAIKDCDRPIPEWENGKALVRLGSAIVAVDDVVWSGYNPKGDNREWMPVEEVDAWIDNQKALLVYSCVKYHDVFGREHFAESCQRAVHFPDANGRGGDIRYANYPHHNSDD